MLKLCINASVSTIHERPFLIVSRTSATVGVREMSPTSGALVHGSDRPRLLQRAGRQVRGPPHSALVTEPRNQRGLSGRCKLY